MSKEEAGMTHTSRDYALDPQSGQVTAFNDDIRVMAVGADQDDADRKFDEAVAALPEPTETAP